MTSEPAERTSPRSGDVGADDLVLPFQAERSRVMGRLVRLGPAVHDVLTRHDYPEPVSRVLGQALALASMLGSTMQDEAQLILQTKSDGPLSFLVVNYEAPGRLRGLARFDGARIAVARGSSEAELIGHGHFAMTIDLGRNAEQYQGIVALEGQTLSDAALGYFQRSAQLPTFIRLAVARHYSGKTAAWSWRAGGLMLQHLSPERGDQFRQGALALADDDAWERTRALAETVEDHELLDPLLAPERLLYRLFHEEGVRVWDKLPIAMACRCSAERVESMLRMFEPEELADMREPDGSLSVTCEYCSTVRRYGAGEFAALRGG
jgi:molecular chaperone Hsp33